MWFPPQFVPPNSTVKILYIVWSCIIDAHDLCHKSIGSIWNVNLLENPQITLDWSGNKHCSITSIEQRQRVTLHRKTEGKKRYWKKETIMDTKYNRAH